MATQVGASSRQECLMLMRRYHRWASFPLIAFLLAVIGTGLYLQAVEIINETQVGEPKALARTAPERAEIVSAVDRALNIAERDHPGFPLQKIEISFEADGHTAKVLTNRRIGPSITVDGTSGQASYVERPPRTIRTVFVLLHSGKYYGLTGLIVIMVASIVLMILCVTGLWVYIDMYRRRRAARKKGLFWK
jgi:uncharacterized iron-regulated membrane protein